jgi:hypothetical protein
MRETSARRFDPNQAESIQLKITDDESGFSMNVAIQIDKSKKSWEYNAYTDFFSEQTHMDPGIISDKIILKLMLKYKTSVSDSIIGVNYGTSCAKKVEAKKSLISTVITSAKGLEHIGKFLEEPRTTTLCTIDHYNNQMIAKTTLKLDADIVTIISSDILSNQILARPFLLLHSYNLLVAYGLLGHQLKEFSKILALLKYIIRVLCFFPSVISFLVSVFQGLPHGSLPIIASSSVVTAILYVYAPRYLFRYVPKLFKIAPRILGYLIKRKLLVTHF